MKFTLRKAAFTTGGATISLSNDNISEERTTEEGASVPVYAQRLLANPIVITNSSTNVQVRHRDHGMYSTVTMLSLLVYHLSINHSCTNALTTTSTGSP